jgi:DNA-binding NarL/FixJ family response regulator
MPHFEKNMKQEVTVLIVDDHPLLRHGLRDFIAGSPHFKIVGEAADGEEALRMIARLKPRIVIIDIDMPRLNGLETIRAIRELPFPVKVIILTMYKEEDMFNAAMDLDVKAYVLKENAANDIMLALEQVDRGEGFVSALLLETGQRRSDRVRELLLSKPQIESLTPAERRILKLVGEDYTSKEIASRLNLSVRTVDNHRQHICDKLKLHGTHSLLKFAFDNSAYL